jgi:hypothetical protein
MPSQRTGRFDEKSLTLVELELKNIADRTTGSGLCGLIAKFFNNRERNEIVSLVDKLHTLPEECEIVKATHGLYVTLESTPGTEIYRDKRTGDLLAILRSVVREAKESERIHRPEYGIMRLKKKAGRG